MDQNDTCISAISVLVLFWARGTLKGPETHGGEGGNLIIVRMRSYTYVVYLARLASP